MKRHLRVGWKIAAGVTALVVLSACFPAYNFYTPSDHIKYVGNITQMNQDRVKQLSDCHHTVYGYGNTWWCLNSALYSDAALVDRYRFLNWTTDGCSVIPDTTFLYDFTASCRVHDFCYRNWKDIERRTGWDFWNPTSRLSCDNTLIYNWVQKCDNSGYLKNICIEFAWTSWATVRLVVDSNKSPIADGGVQTFVTSDGVSIPELTIDSSKSWG